MGLLSLARDDRALLVGLSVATVGIFVGMRAILLRFRDSSEIKPIQPKLRYITQETEDSLPMSTLDGLLDHYNYSIRDTAAKIVCDRAVNDPQTLQLLLWGITRVDYEERMKNLRALAMLTDLDSLHLLDTPTAYSAFVRSLQLCVGETQYDMVEDDFFDEYYLRDISEKLCLMFVAQLVHKCRHGADKLVQAGFVERWLARQRWGTTEEQRMNNFAHYLACRDNRITDICKRLFKTKAGNAALERARLMRPQRQSRRHGGLQPQKNLHGRRGTATSRHRRQTNQQLEEDQQEQQENRDPTTADWMLHRSIETEERRQAEGDGEARAQVHAEVRADTDTDTNTDADAGVHTDSDMDAAQTGQTEPVQTRQHGRSTREEQRIRRQHREAMVLNDGTRPLRRDDIIQRGGD